MKISGRVVSTRPISLSRAAKLLSRFAAVENGSSPSVSHYLQRASRAFNHLLQFHDKRSKPNNRATSIQTTENDGDSAQLKKKIKKRKSGEVNLDSLNTQSENIVRESGKKKKKNSEAKN